MSTSAATGVEAEFVHRDLPSGIEFAADLLPYRDTVAINFRILTGVGDEPEELTGIASVVARTVSKGTQKYDGRGLADAFDALGAKWSMTSGRQSTIAQVLCLPEFTLQAVDLVAEMICRPTFPGDACRVAVELAQHDLKSLEDDPQSLNRTQIQRLTLGPILGRHPGGDEQTLARITPDSVRSHWKRNFHTGRMQVAAAGPIDVDALAGRLDAAFGGLGSRQRDGRGLAPVTFTPGRDHRNKDLQQQYIAISLPGLRRDDRHFAIEQVLLGILSGGMSGRLFTEVREKQGLVYWVGAWHEQLRGCGFIHMGASTTPERCQKTFDTLLRELRRLSDDLTESETARAKNSLIAHSETEDDLTRARANGLSDDLFHFGRPVGLAPKLAAVRAVTVEQVEKYVARLPREEICVATLGPKEL
jgi:predicted Zn-dependent peptidase